MQENIVINSMCFEKLARLKFNVTPRGGRKKSNPVSLEETDVFPSNAIQKT